MRLSVCMMVLYSMVFLHPWRFSIAQHHHNSSDSSALTGLVLSSCHGFESPAHTSATWTEHTRLQHRFSPLLADHKLSAISMNPTPFLPLRHSFLIGA
jgi:hypothetical protein